jgi:hypothetical protein
MLFRVLSSSPRSVFSRLAYQSLWPNILGTDAAGVKKVDKRIKTLSLLATLVQSLLHSQPQLHLWGCILPYN